MSWLDILVTCTSSHVPIQLVAIIIYISTMNGFDGSWCTEGNLCWFLLHNCWTINVGSQTPIHCLCLIVHKIHWPFFHWQIRCPLLISRAYIFAWQHNLHVNNKLPPSITAVQLSTARRWLFLHTIPPVYYLSTYITSVVLRRLPRLAEIVS